MNYAQAQAIAMFVDRCKFCGDVATDSAFVHADTDENGVQKFAVVDACAEHSGGPYCPIESKLN